MGQLLDRMGRYIKGVETLILSDRIHSLSLSRKAYTPEQASTWALANKFFPQRIKVTDKDIVLELKAEPHYSRRSNKEEQKISTTIKATCYKTINPHMVVVSRKRVQDSQKAKSMVEELGLKSSDILSDDDYFYFKQFDVDAKNTSEELRKRISPQVEYIYYERASQSFDEENQLKTIKRKSLLEQPKSFQVHASLEVASKSEKSAGGDFVIEGFASTGEIDRDQDIVAPEAFAKALDLYMENPICCYMHNWADPIGVISYAKVVPAGQNQSVGRKTVSAPTGGLFVRAAISNTVPRIRQLIEEGVLKAFSIGFMIKDAQYDEARDVRVITDLELYEISVVTIPSNRRSLFSVSKALKNGTDLMCQDCSLDEHKEKECCAHSHNENASSNDELRARMVSAVKEKKLTLKNLPVEDCVGNYCKTFSIDPKGLDFHGSLEDSITVSHDEVRSLGRTQKSKADLAKQGTQLEKFLNTETHEQRVLSEAFGYYELSLIAKAIKAVTSSDSWENTKTQNFDWQGGLARSVYAQLEVGRDKTEELLVDGFMFIKNEADQRVVAQITPGWNCFYLNLFYSPAQSEDTASKFLKAVKDWASENNFYKGEKITYTGKFLSLADMSFDDLKLPETQKQAIKVGALDFFTKKELYKKNSLPYKRGMIFSGEPGTGKTLTGKILLSKCKTTFVWVTASDLYGSGDAKHLFAMARTLAPCIIFAEDVDEFISHKSCVDALKTEMDGLKSNDGVVTILCTNFPDKLPAALIDRPGRFDDVIKFELPDEEHRYAILMEHSKSMDIENREQALKDIASRTEKFSGAHLKELLTYALLLTVDSNRELITAKDLEASLTKMVKTRELVASLGLSKAYTKGLSRKVSNSKTVRKEFTANTDDTVGENSVGHTHDIRLFLEFDSLEQIVSVEGMANQGNNDHSHPIMDVGKTEIVNDHYHTYTTLSEAGGTVTASFRVEGSKLKKVNSETYSFKNSTREFVIVTTQAEGASVADHEHVCRVSVTFDDAGEILTVSGIAEQGNNDHSHTISEFGETEQTQNHYHRYTLVWDATSTPVQPTTETPAPPAINPATPASEATRPDSPDMTPPAAEPEAPVLTASAPARFVIPKDIMEDVIEVAVLGMEAGHKKVLNVVEYLEDLFTHGSKKANSLYYARELKRVTEELAQSKVALQARLTKVLGDLKAQGIF